jgi:serine/threonine protein kinase
MLSGKLPFQGSLSELNYHRQHTPFPLEELAQIPQPVVALLDTLLQKNPDQRFQTPTELLQAIPKVTDAIESRRRLTTDQLRSGTDIGLKRPRTGGRFLRGLSGSGRTRGWFLALGFIVAGLFFTWFFWSGRAGSLFTRPVAETAVTQKSIAVLPFENLSANPDDAYFADGVQSVNSRS